MKKRKRLIKQVLLSIGMECQRVVDMQDEALGISLQ
jgi:hypothetical protein